MRFGQAGKKALKAYAGLKTVKGVTKLAAVAAAGFGAYRLYQSRKGLA